MNFKCNKAVILCQKTFIGKGYLSHGLFKVYLNHVMIKSLDVDVVSTFVFVAYNVVDSSNLWHGRLGHINFNSLKRMMNLKLIPNYAIDNSKRCDICVQAKQLKKPFKSVVRDSEILDLVHSDICEFNGILTRDHKKYFITFIDDCSRY